MLFNMQVMYSENGCEREGSTEEQTGVGTDKEGSAVWKSGNSDRKDRDVGCDVETTFTLRDKLPQSKH